MTFLAYLSDITPSLEFVKMQMFICTTCGQEWPTNYCPECAHTIVDVRHGESSVNNKGGNLKINGVASDEKVPGTNGPFNFSKQVTSILPITIVIVCFLSGLFAVSMLISLSSKGKSMENIVSGEDGGSLIKRNDTMRQFAQSVFSFQYPRDWVEFTEQERQTFIREFESQSRELFKAYHGSSAEDDTLVPYAFGLNNPDESVTCGGVLMRIPPQATNYIDTVYARSMQVFEWGKQQGRVKEVISNEKAKIGGTPVVRSELVWTGGEHHIIVTYHFPEAPSYSGTFLITMKPDADENARRDASKVLSSLRLSPPSKEWDYREEAGGSGMGSDRVEPTTSYGSPDVNESHSQHPRVAPEMNPPTAIVGKAALGILDNVVTDAYREGDSHVLTLEQIKTIVAAGVCPPETSGMQRQDLLLTLAIAVRLLPSDMRISLPEIQPDASGDPLVLIQPKDVNTPEESQTSFEAKQSGGLAAVKNVGGLILPRGSSRLADGFLMTKGDSPANSSTPRRNVRSYLTVRAMPGFSTYVLGTDLPRETVPYSMSDGRGFMGSPKAVVPNGEGSILRFRGVVKDFFKGWTIQGDDGEPLSFVLIRGEGLTYIFGKGSMYGPGNRRYEFAGLSRIKR